MLKKTIFSHSQTFKSLVLPVCSLSSTSANLKNQPTVNVFEAKPKVISEYVSFRSAQRDAEAPEHRPLVVLYGWLVAKARHIHKYGDFYLGKGYDVIHVKVSPGELLRPKKAQAVVEQVLDYIKTDHPGRALLFHGFSVGCYIYGETLVKLNSDPQERFKDVGKRACGQVMDSPVDSHNVPFGVGRALTNSPFLQKSVQVLLESYLKAFYKSTTIHHIRASNAFKENQLRLPTLYLYSKADKVAAPEEIEKLRAEWKARGLESSAAVFENSPHVSHLHMYPIQYINALNTFLEKSMPFSQQESKMVKSEDLFVKSKL